MGDAQQAQGKRKRSQHDEDLPNSPPERSQQKKSRQEGSPGSSSHVPDDVQSTRAAATVGDGSLLEKLPKELRVAIYDAVFESTLVHSEKMVEIMRPEFVGLKSLLGVNRKMRHEVQEVLRERMGRQVIFKATCYNHQEEVEAASKSKGLFHGKVPGDRHVRVLRELALNGRWACYGPTEPLWRSVTWRKDSVGWNL
ncbi:hypothetical protein MBLNU13_g02979t3 [Cladosporium sp. NU13]